MIKEVDVDGDGRIDFYGKPYPPIKVSNNRKIRGAGNSRYAFSFTVQNGGGVEKFWVEGTRKNLEIRGQDRRILDYWQIKLKRIGEVSDIGLKL